MPILLLALFAAAPAHGSATERTAAAHITAAEISGHIRFLADDLLEGRKPGTHGADLAVKYIATEMESMGLSPGATAQDGSPSWFQPVPLVELRGRLPREVVFRGPGGEVSLSPGQGVKSDLRLDPDAHVEVARVRDAALVFTEDGARKLARLGGQDLDALRMQAQNKNFRPVPMPVRTSLEMPIERFVTESANVLGKVPGTDAKLRDEVVMYTAHWDHLGRRDPAPGTTDGIYNGALDNASGCASILAIARAAKEAAPRRSMLFVFVTAEEQGLLGSRWFAQHPTVRPGRIAADINLDSVNKWGPTADLGMLGLGKSTLDADVKQVASEQGREVHGDPFPDRGAFYRSDQFELARIGVPVVAIRGGPNYLGRPPGWGAAQHEAFERTDYHQVTDEYHGDWDLAGAVEDAQLDLLVGLRIANATSLPQWKPGDEFEKARKTAAR